MACTRTDPHPLGECPNYPDAPESARSVTHGGHVQGLPIPGHVRSVRTAAYVKPDGTVGLFWTRDRAGAYHGIELYGIGPAGAVVPFAVLASGDARTLAAALVVEADRLDAAEAAAR